ncbi:MAG: ATP-binding protein [Myxococcota bacterium]
MLRLNPDRPNTQPLEADPVDVERRWETWLLERNRMSTRIAFWLTITIYPMFGLLDWMVAPSKWWPLLFTTRAVVSLWSLWLLAIHRGEFFSRHWRILTSGHAVMLGGGISVMTVVMGGYETPYYAGLNLSVMGVGLLFVWTGRQAAWTYGLVVASYVIPNAFHGGPINWAWAAPNLFFVSSTATVVTAAQAFGFRSNRDQVLNQIRLEQTTANLERAHAQLQQLDAFKTKFFANITHELKTPLAMILSPLELLIQEELGRLTDVQRSTLQTMFRNGFKLLNLINDLLDLTKLEESRLRLRIAQHDMVEWLGNLVGHVQPLAQRKRVALVFNASVADANIWCDIERIERVMINLLSNAVKFTPPEGHIAVRLFDDGGAVRIEVVDDGRGFPPEMADRVFERFFQVDMGGTRKHGGTGIGLALARELVGLHGGRIYARGAEGKGACFTVELLKGRSHFRPDTLTDASEPADALKVGRPHQIEILGGAVEVDGRDDFRLLDISELTERRVVERDQDENQRQWTVLIVEDTPDVIRVIHLALRRHFKVMAAPDGLKGLEMAVRELPSLIITDLMMPGIDGLELTRRLREDPRTRHTPIVMLTARGDLEDRVRGLDTGVNAYLSKPFSAKELLSTARSLLNIQETQADLLLNSRLDSLETIAGGLAHEINNPLNYVKNALRRVEIDVHDTVELMQVARGRALSDEEIARLQKNEERVHKMIEMADGGVKRIAATVDLMGRYSREGYSRAMRLYDAFGAVRDIVTMVLPATGRPVKVDVDLEGDGYVDCVPEELNQVLSNLLQNAIEAVADESGCVSVSGRGDDDWVTVTVADNGHGISDEAKARIFTPFFTTKGPGRGMGMGLTIVRRVVQSLGGTLQLTSEAGVGTTFIVRLPRRSPVDQQALPLT